ncbi:hypothetical protein I4U23_011171 [Adineta vaga]|nr:hypothetical protein I4U23_011171 [Adineta vaga]
MYNIYAPAETTVVSFYHRVNFIRRESHIALGRLLSNEHYKVLDIYFQYTPVGQQGELFIGGAGVFAGYLHRMDLTSKVLLEINDEKFYRTGDLVKVDHEGLLHYEGRTDHQIKLHGQRIELGEIERCLLSISFISACVVIKWGEDHLVAYVQSSVINEKELRDHCQSHLPPHMIPSRFIILDQLPLNANGKIDRKRLLSPDFASLSSINLNDANKLLEPTSEIESIIHRIWCDLLKQKQISINTNIFTIGGHSLIIMQLLHRFKVEFRLEINSIAISDLFQHPTIIDHAQLIHQIVHFKLNKDNYCWHSLNILTAKASFAQERIFLDENIRFCASAVDDITNMYVIPLIYRVSSLNIHHISISRLYHAYQCIIRKHKILRTALYLDRNGVIVQDCRNTNYSHNDIETYAFSIVNVSKEDHDKSDAVKRILNKSDLFDLSKGHVINCHILRSQNSSNENDDDMLTRDDLILFTIHHAFFDGASTSIFIRDLSLAYQDDSSLFVDVNSFQYIDYSIHEHIMAMTLAREFWFAQLHGCDLQHSLSLPYDRSHSSNRHRSGLASTTQITLNDSVCTSFLHYASSHHLTLFQLGLSIFYVFLFKLSHNDTDLCVGTINANRYRSELYNMIGMFVATLPYHIQLNADWSFDELVHHVREMCVSILEHSHYPLQHILNDFHLNQSNLRFLETIFDFITLSENETYLSMNDTRLEEVSLDQSYEVSKFDFMLSFVYNPTKCVAPASYAQARIWLDEQMRFDPDHPQVAIYNMPFVYHFSPNNTISIKQLQHALYLTVNKHLSLHTAFIFDKNKNILMQRIVEINNNHMTLFTFTESTYQTQEQLNNIIQEEKRNPQLFNLAQGLLLSEKDIIIFNFHHAAFDFPSMQIFLHDLNQAYITGQLLDDNNDKTNLRYLDYAAIEQQMSMTGAQMFWLDTLHNSKLDQLLPLPYDRYRLANEHRTGRGTSISFDFGQDLSHYFLSYASTNNMSLEYLSLITYFIFLFKLTNGEKDLCIGMNTEGRYRDEFRSIIGMFVNAIPLRYQLDPHSSFHKFTEEMRVLITNTKKYSYFPLQRILAQHPHLSNPAFLDTSFDFTSSMTNADENKIMLGGNELILAPYSIEISEDEIMSKFDFIVTFHHTLDLNELSCSINASLDLFHIETVNKIAQQLHSMLYQLSTSSHSQLTKPLYELSLILPNEQLLVQSMNNTEISFPSVKCIHHEFVSNAMKYSQKLAVELDDQSLTYCELLYYVQVLSLTLLNKYCVKVGEIICQCVERSISMVIGIMGILMAGGAYCPLSPRDPPHRLHSLVEQTQSRIVLTHWLTKNKLDDENIVVNIDLLVTNSDMQTNLDDSDNVPRTTLEQQLQNIFSQAFSIESPHFEVSFSHLGGTSLNAIHALTLIRQEINANIDIGLIFTNPSIRQLAQAIEASLIFDKQEDILLINSEDHETCIHLEPSFLIESLGIIALICHGVLPILIIAKWCPLLFFLLPAIHLLFYAIYRLWNNNTFWLRHILGTSFYNYYLRLCGAHVNLHAHIYTTTIDAPWLLEIGDGTWIADKTILNCLHFNNNYTFELRSIKIDSDCSIGTRSTLFDGVEMQSNVFVQPMSAVTGFIPSQTIIDGEEYKSASSDISMTVNNRSFSVWHKIYQVFVLMLLTCIHFILLIIIYKVYLLVPLRFPLNVALCWTLWSFIGCCVSLFLLKFAVGYCVAGETYPIASWSYLNKLWLRQLIVSSFHHTWLLTTNYDHLYPVILRWLGAHVENNVKLAEIHTYLAYPTNLLRIETGVTSFGYVLLVPTEVTFSGGHLIDHITVGSYTNIANKCSILPGSCLAPYTMVGNFTRITRETATNEGNIVMGVPARVMPFQMPIVSTMEDQIEVIPFWKTWFTYFTSKYLLVVIYSLCGLVGGSIIHTIFVCSFYRCRSYIHHQTVDLIISQLQQDHQRFICPFLGNTQWLVRLFRAFGAHIGKNVVLPDINSLFDYKLVTIEDDVRFNINAHIMCHTFEQRILKLAPVTVKNSCVFMSHSGAMPGCKLMGNNRLYPNTLIMKNDILPANTHWKGFPARQSRN